jgi:hypothetical protein
MKTDKRKYFIAGFVMAAGSLALLSSHSRHVKTAQASLLPKFVTFSQKLSAEDQTVVSANLNKAMGKTLSSNSAATTNNPALVDELRDRASVEKFRDLELCLEPRNPCDIAQTEPRSSDLWVSDRVMRELQGLRLAFSQLSAEDQNAVRGDLATVTDWALSFQDDYVREEGMRLSRYALPPEQRVQAVITSLKESVSAPLYDLGLSILRENKEVATKDQVDFYVQTIQTGGYYASEEVARQILPYLNDDNIVRFVELRNQLPAESNTAIYLNENIKEYRMVAQGG